MMKERHELPLDALQLTGKRRRDRVARNGGTFQTGSDQSAVKRDEKDKSQFELTPTM